jgi:tryptophanyl-tRNA synthetase
MSIVTDSTPLEEPKDPDNDNVFALIRLFADDETRERIELAYRRGGYGYGHAKKELLGMIDESFAEARERRKELADKPERVREILHECGKRARAKAQAMMEAVRDRVGIVITHT